jgi:UDP-GlcNAc:undecaprenyl-phosphate GlcNAc-1-phosphate transferase
LVSLPLTIVAARLGVRLNALDSDGVPGQVKAARRAIPNTGGIAIFLGVALPMLAGLAVLHLAPADAIARWLPGLVEHMAGLRSRTPMALVLLAGVGVLHVVGLVDDRRPMGPWFKLAVMLAVSFLVVRATDTRLLTLLDARVGGAWLSIAVTVLWIVAITNAMNFLDNMDGLSGGIGAICAGCFLASALIHGQWFVSAGWALLVGALLGFLALNRPPARIFMGDGGSLVLGFLLAFLSVRTTYFDTLAAGPASGAWYGVLAPLVVLAVPLYDFTSVVVLRLSQGRSPFVGDLQHVSHRLVEMGLTRPAAVAVVCGLTATTGLAGVSLASLQPWQAALVGAQTLLTLLVLALFEHSRRTGNAGEGR